MEFLEVLLFTSVVALLIAFWIWQRGKTEEFKVRVRGQTGGKAKTVLAARQLGKHDGETEKTSVEGQTGGEAVQVFAFDKADGKDLKDLGVWKGEECPKKPAVPREEDCYKMTSTPRGLCVIINNWDFINKKKNRLSAKDHGVKLRELFKKLQFNVLLRENQTMEEIEMIFKTAAEASHTKYDCFICYILSHGMYDVVLSKDCKKVHISSLSRRFRPKNCDSLRDKPKLFFVDACRIEDDNPLSDIFSVDDEKDTKEIKDFFFGYSTQRYSKAYKNPETGPIFTDEFIKAMEKTLTEKKDLESLMRDVKREVEARVLYVGNEENRALPDPDSKLTKQLYFM